MGSVYKLPDTWTLTFDRSNHEKVSARNDYAKKPLIISDDPGLNREEKNMNNYCMIQNSKTFAFS